MSHIYQISGYRQRVRVATPLHSLERNAPMLWKRLVGRKLDTCVKLACYGVMSFYKLVGN